MTTAADGPAVGGTAGGPAAATPAGVEQLRRLVARSASRWKRLLVLEAIGLAVSAPLAYLWLVFLLDNTIHLPVVGRLLASVLFLAGLGYLIYSLVRRWRRLHFTEDQVALAMERRTPGGLENRLINAIQLARDPRAAEGGVGHAVVEENYQRLQEARVEQAAQLRPALVRVATAAALIVIGLLFWSLQREKFTNAATRIFLPLADVNPIYRTVLEVSPGDKQIAGGDVVVGVRVRGEVPETVTILLNTANGKRSETIPVSGHTASYTIKDVRQTLSYAVKGGDYRSPYYRLEVPSAPGLAVVRATHHLPAYTGLGEKKTETAGGDLEALAGTKSELHFILDQPADSAVMVVQRTGANGPAGEAASAPASSGPAKSSADASLRRISLKKVSATEFVGEVTFEGVSGYQIETKQDDRRPPHTTSPYALRVIDDADPRLELSGLDRQGEAAIDAAIPLKALATDDYGLQKVGLFRRRVAATSVVPGAGGDAAKGEAANAAASPSGSADEGWEAVEVWEAKGASELRQAPELSVPSLAAAEGEKFEIALRGVDTDPAKKGRWITGTPYTLAIGGEGVALQIAYEQILRSEAGLKALIAQQQAAMGKAAEWVQKFDPAAGLRWDDPKTVETLAAAMKEQASAQDGIQKAAGLVVRDMLPQAMAVRQSLSMLADNEMSKATRVLETVAGRDNPQNKRGALADARIVQERTIRSLQDLLGQHVKFREDWELANMIPFSKMLADREAGLRDDAKKYAEAGSLKNPQGLQQSAGRRQGKVVELAGLAGTATAGLGQRLTAGEPTLAAAFTAASGALGAADLKGVMQGAGEDAAAGRWSAAGEKQATAAAKLMDVHLALRKAQAEAAQLAVKALEDKAKSDLAAQQAIDKLRAGTKDDLLDLAGKDIKVQDILHMQELAQKGQGDDSPVKPEMYMFEESMKSILTQPDVGKRQEFKNLKLADTPTKSMSFPNSSDRIGNAVKPQVQEKFEDLLGNLLQEADELGEKYDTYNLNYQGGINEAGDVGKQGGDINSTAAAAATGNQKQPKNDFGGASRTGRQGARAHGMQVGDEGVDRKGRDKVQEGQEETPDQAGTVKMSKSDDPQGETSTGVGGKKVETGEPTSFSTQDKGEWKDEMASRMEKPKEKELIVERQAGPLDPRVAEMLRDLTSKQEQVIERVKSIKKELNNLYLPTDQLDALTMQLQSNLETLRERPNADVFRLQEQTLDKLTAAIRVVNRSYSGSQTSLPRDQAVRGRVLDEPAKPVLSGYDEAVKNYYEMLSTP